jgi:predicted PurR-regulated permease PerM
MTQEQSVRPGGRAGANGMDGGLGGGRDWRRLRDTGVAMLAWIAVLGVILWGLAHVVGSLLLFILAAILAYALSPAVKHLERFMPRGFAIALVYLGILTTLSGLIYLIVITAVGQVSMLLKDVESLLTPSTNGAESPLVTAFKAVGLTDAQIKTAGQRILDQVQGLTGDAVGVAAGVVDALVRTVLVGVLSIYLLKDGPHIVQWLRTSTPIVQRPRIVFFVDTLDAVVGGYIRGQLTLSALIGLLVGGGMWFFHVPYAVFLGVLAFVLEFVPILGVFISGTICVLVAMTMGNLLTTAFVLAYFILVHFIEGDFIGPRIMSRAVGLHPAISILALFAGSELFSVWGALFAAPMTGLIQAIVRAVWLEWRESHPEQFPTGYTVDPAVRIIPVTHAEAPTPPTVEPEASAKPAEPIHPEATLVESVSAWSPEPSKDSGIGEDAGGVTSEAATPDTLAELASAVVLAQPVGPDTDAAAGAGAAGDSESGPPVGELGERDGVVPAQANQSMESAANLSLDEAHLLPDVRAWTPQPLVASIYDRFRALEPHLLGCEGEDDGESDWRVTADADGWFAGEREEEADALAADALAADGHVDGHVDGASEAGVGETKPATEPLAPKQS